RQSPPNACGGTRLINDTSGGLLMRRRAPTLPSPAPLRCSGEGTRHQPQPDKPTSSRPSLIPYSAFAFPVPVPHSLLSIPIPFSIPTFASLRGLCAVCESLSSPAKPLLLLLVMPAELLAHRREQSVRVGVFVSGAEAREERGRKRRHGDAQVNRGFERPASFAGIGDVSREAVEL